MVKRTVSYSQVYASDISRRLFKLRVRIFRVVIVRLLKLVGLLFYDVISSADVMHSDMRFCNFVVVTDGSMCP